MLLLVWLSKTCPACIAFRDRLETDGLADALQRRFEHTIQYIVSDADAPEPQRSAVAKLFSDNDVELVPRLDVVLPNPRHPSSNISIATPVHGNMQEDDIERAIQITRQLYPQVLRRTKATDHYEAIANIQHAVATRLSNSTP